MTRKRSCHLICRSQLTLGLCKTHTHALAEFCESNCSLLIFFHFFFRFSLSVYFQCGFVLRVGYGHLALDTLFSTYYAHAQTQLKIIKHQLENFVNKEEHSSDLNSYIQYRDLMDESVRKRFIVIVKRYEKLLW